MKIPFAERVRPKQLKDYISQEHLVGQDGIISKILENGLIPSFILWGPPGSGKTTLAQIISEISLRPFYKLNAIDTGVKEIRTIIEQAKKDGGLFEQKQPIVFIDEIHRFNKTQQDALLSAVERGWITLIGATTENPSFEVIPALLSRCQIFTVEPLKANELNSILKNAIKKDTYFKTKNIILEQTDELIKLSGGDARKLLNYFELIIEAQSSKKQEGKPITITNKIVKREFKDNILPYDKTGDFHFDVASALIKSIRGSDPNAATYWLARMLKSGEDVKFIARRLIISASEDIGLANPNALMLANSTFEAVKHVGMPEARIILSQCVIYLATSEKSNSSYLAIKKAYQIIENQEHLNVPIHLKNAPTKLMKELGYGNDYLYPHDYENTFVHQNYLPVELENQTIYQPKNNKRETLLKQFLKKIWKQKYGY